ncbi:glycosyltransferase family 39 protein [Mycetocola tolaasinivorans]|uniref:glycosyltransferase family 39 protein n=1 Tax=Mycetocola tolaasinivorans TaxID=76635 RepID=UPI001600DD9C|nr:glycosyltransferase family 39 protein [Mycetocola tolaasinivorans]
MSTPITTQTTAQPAVVSPLPIAPPVTRRSVSLAVLLGAVGAGISWTASAIPSYWFDEIATVEAAHLAPAQLWELVQHKDIVHGIYYLIIHGWIALFGDSPMAVRGFSALAVGAGVAGMVALGARLGNLRLGVIAALIFAIIPRTTFMGVEARSYALTTAIAVWAVVMLVVAARRNRWWLWGIYAIIMIVSIYLFMYGALVLVAHAAYLLSRHRERRVLVPWALSTLLILISVIPLVVAGYGQRGQIAWIQGRPSLTFETIVMEPWLDKSWLLGICAVVVLGLAAIRIRWILTGQGAPVVVLAAVWAFGPLLLIVIASLVFGPLFTPRYVSFTTPGFALLLALAVTVYSRRWITWILVASLALAALPTFVAQRGPEGKGYGTDFQRIAAIMSRDAHPGDAFYLQRGDGGSLSTRLTIGGYPEAFQGLRDIAFLRSDLVDGYFDDQTVPPRDLGHRLDGVNTIWVAEKRTPTAEITSLIGILHQRGFVARERFWLSANVVVEYVRMPHRHSSSVAHDHAAPPIHRHTAALSEHPVTHGILGL